MLLLDLVAEYLRLLFPLALGFCKFFPQLGIH